MKEFDPPMVTITQEEHEQLLKCKGIVESLWRKLGPYNWPEVFQLPKGKTWRDILQDVEETAFYKIRTDIELLMGFDDSE